MRTLALALGCLVLPLAGLSSASAQEVGDTLTLTGCLVQEDDDEAEVEYLLENVTDTRFAAWEIELFAGEGVSLAPHVGHTVEVTGVVVADEDEAEEAEDEDELEDRDVSELHLEVTSLGHVAASCPGT